MSPRPQPPPNPSGPPGKGPPGISKEEPRVGPRARRLQQQLSGNIRSFLKQQTAGRARTRRVGQIEQDSDLSGPDSSSSNVGAKVLMRSETSVEMEKKDSQKKSRVAAKDLPKTPKASTSAVSPRLQNLKRQISDAAISIRAPKQSNPQSAFASELQVAAELAKSHEKKHVKLHDPTFRSLFHQYCSELVESNEFSGMIMFFIALNTVTIAVEANSTAQISVTMGDTQGLHQLLEPIGVVFLWVYLFEAIIKIYAEPRSYWMNNYNRFDFFILTVSLWQFGQTYLSTEGAGSSDVTFLRVLRALRALRALRSVSFISSLQVIVVALVKTVQNVVYIVGLLLMIMYVFAIMGYYLYGDQAEDFKSLGTGFMTLFVYVTADGWTNVIQRAGDKGQDISIYSIVFIFIGNFICTNLFIGVIVQNLEEATEEERVRSEREKRILFSSRKKTVLAKQDAEMQQIMSQWAAKDLTFDEMLNTVGGSLRHNDIIPMTSMYTNLTWLETYIASAKVQENIMYRTQQIHFEMAHALASIATMSLESAATCPKPRPTYKPCVPEPYHSAAQHSLVLTLPAVTPRSHKNALPPAPPTEAPPLEQTYFGS